MDNDILFFKLRDCLAELYPDQETARIVAIEAGLDERHIAFSGRAQTNWHHILAEAIKTYQVNVLLNTVSNVYPAFPPFRAAYSDYLDAGSTLTLPGNKDKPLSPSHKLLHNLPHPDYEKFIGRQKEMEQIRRLLLPYPHSRHWVVTIDGVGGIGKSALALEIAHSFCWGGG